MSWSQAVFYNQSTSLTNRVKSQTDVTPPNIWSWDISKNANQSVPFTAWANVTDDGVGIRNVTVHVIAPNYTLVEELVYNGTFYEGQLEPLIFPGDYDLQLRAFDLNNNTRTGRHIIVTIPNPATEPVDESVTMPIVVATSILLAIIVVVGALMYDKHSTSLE